MTKIKYEDLSKPLKALVVLGWILAGYLCLFFLVGFVIGITETI